MNISAQMDLSPLGWKTAVTFCIIQGFGEECWAPMHWRRTGNFRSNRFTRFLQTHYINNEQKLLSLVPFVALMLGELSVLVCCFVFVLVFGCLRFYCIHCSACAAERLCFLCFSAQVGLSAGCGFRCRPIQMCGGSLRLLSWALRVKLLN